MTKSIAASPIHVSPTPPCIIVCTLYLFMQAAAWVAFGVMAVITIIYVVVLVFYCRKRRRSASKSLDSGRKNSKKSKESKSEPTDHDYEPEDKPSKPI